ncbi:MAG: hypothetical protein J0H99_17410, partial [Rhodospirillales bacterium]|nr:hypothetical protein [Rhodospirillales bacterium]
RGCYRVNGEAAACQEVIFDTGEWDTVFDPGSARSMRLGPHGFLLPGQDFELDVNVGTDLGELIIPTLGGQASSTTVQSSLSQNIPVVRQGSHVDVDWIEVRLVINQLVHNSDDGSKGRDLDIKIEIKPSSSPTWTPAVLYADMGTTTQKDDTGLKVIQRDDIESAMTAARTQVVWDQTSQPNPTSAQRALGGAFQPDGLTTAGISGRMSAPFEDSNYIALIDPARTNIERTFFFYETGTPVSPRVGDLWLNPSTSVLLWFNGASWVSSITAEAGAYDPTAGNKIISPVGWLHIHDKITSNAVREVRIKVDRIGDTYDLRVTKQTADSDSFADDRTDVSWESFQEIKSEPMRFPHLATARLKGRASDQFSSLPTFQGVYEGRLVKVPSNYNPTTRNYDGVWDGTWKQAYTNNPAFIGYDLVENDRYGMS